jgi:hypothetical protein
MKTERFSKTPKPTPRDITEVLAGISDATDFEEQAAQEEGLSITEYEKRHGRRKTTSLKPEPGERKDKIKEREKRHDIKSWFFYAIPAELRTNVDVFEIFQKYAQEKDFQDLWNRKMFLKEGLNETELIRHSLDQIQDLGFLSGITINLEDVAKTSLSGEIRRIEEEIKDQEAIIKSQSTFIYNNSGRKLGNVNIPYFLKRKIIIEKLEDMLALLIEYKPIG